jgi:uncharacterized protein (UPF0335 family)
MSKQIEALLIERAGYEKRNLPSRVQAVDAALRELGFDHKYMTKETTTAVPDEERAVAPAATKRTIKKD